MMKKSLTVGLVGAMLLAGCATTGKNLTPEQQEAQLKENQLSLENRKYSKVDSQKVGETELLLRKPLLGAEDELVIIKRGKTAGLTTLMVVGLVATGGMSGGQTFKKDDLKGTVLEPKFKNPTLEYAKQPFADWLTKHQADIVPSGKSVERLAVSEGRFALIYDKLVGKEAYHLNTDLTIAIRTSWDNRGAYEQACDIKSSPKTLEEWQADNYKAVDKAIKANIATCLRELTDKKVNIKHHFSK